MIRIRKPADPPTVLRKRGPAATTAICDLVADGKPVVFDRDLYGANEVKEALGAAQHDKCCFCETRLTHAQFGDVEHYRPKARAQQGAAAPPSIGYYWLAYEWSNLYLSCAVCNRRHKRCLFPLVTPERRVSSHHRAHDLDAEQPIFVDPGREDPMELIEFRREYAAAIDGNLRARETISALGLDRTPLEEQRRDRYKALSALISLVGRMIEQGLTSDARHDVTVALDVLIAASGDHGEYASMVRSMLRRAAPWRPTWNGPAESLLVALEQDAAAGHMIQINQP